MWTAVRVKLISKNWTKLELSIGKGKGRGPVSGITNKLSCVWGVVLMPLEQS